MLRMWPKLGIFAQPVTGKVFEILMEHKVFTKEPLKTSGLRKL